MHAAGDGVFGVAHDMVRAMSLVSVLTRELGRNHRHPVPPSVALDDVASDGPPSEAAFRALPGQPVHCHAEVTLPSEPIARPGSKECLATAAARRIAAGHVGD